MKVKKEIWTESNVAALVSKRFPSPAFAFLQSVRNGTGFSRKRTRTADAIAVSCYPSRGLYMTGIEIKCNYADWKKELADPTKAESIQRFCRFWFVAAPKGMVPLSELPETWGLIECLKNRTVITKDAPRQDCATPDMLFLCSILRNFSDAYVPKIEVQRMVDQRIEVAVDNSVRRKEMQLDDLRNVVSEFEDASGISLRQRWETGDIGKAVKLVREHGVDRSIHCARKLAVMYESESKLIRKAIADMSEIAALAPWYGSNRINAERVGELLRDCEWCGIPFAGGMCEIPFIRARTIVANDLHENIINLAVAVTICGHDLKSTLRRQLFHPSTLKSAQEKILETPDKTNRFDLACAYFIVAWMTRSGTAGTNGEATGKLALRWNAGGGDSAKRYHSAIDSLEDWCKELQRCTFSCLDAFDFLDKCKDQHRHGIYVDPPFFGAGKKYTHNCGDSRDEQETWHFRLAARLEKFTKARVVVRAYDCDFVRVCYSPTNWEYHRFKGRKQTNDEAPEVLLVRN